MIGRICGTGSYIPSHRMDNVELSSLVDTSDEWIRERTGIQSRHLAKQETVSFMAAKAAEEALADSGLKAEEIDLILVATSSSETVFPNTSCEVQKAIGAVHAWGYDLNTALYEKMAAEQDKYRDWLKSQPPEEILHHTYEYTVREDIVMAMEELELTDAQAQALLESPSPLADVYRYFEKLETGYMDVIRDSIESRADDVCRAKEELRTTPVYPHSAAYASEHGEMAQYNLSYQANSACKEAIEQTISAHYAENRLDTEAAVKDVLEKFGMERVQFILANTIQRKNYDGRISQDNKAWAKTIPMLEDSGASRHCAYLVVDQVNPGLTDLFTRQFRKVAQEQQKSSVLQKLKQEPPARKPATPKKREPER